MTVVSVCGFAYFTKLIIKLSLYSHIKILTFNFFPAFCSFKFNILYNNPKYVQ